MFKPKTAAVPTTPGVYWFLQSGPASPKGGKVIYVGKAKNLKNRLNSYRQLASLDPKTRLMLESADRFKFKSLDSEIEAILTESRLIQLYQPHFNLILKDNKSPVYLTITKELYPRVLITRQTGTFGPFKSNQTLRQILERLRHIFPYCNATAAQKKKHQACFYFHLNLCPGACVGQISPADYQKNIHHLKLFFQNKQKRLLSGLNQEMLQFSKTQQYEAAAKVNRQLQALADFWQAQFIPLELPRLSSDHIALELKQLFGFPIHRLETYDISNLSGTNPTGGMVVATDGKINKNEYRLFNIRDLTTSNDPAMMAEMLQRRLNHLEWGKPDLIIVDGSITQIKAVLKVTASQIPVVGLAKNPDRLVFYNPLTRRKTIKPLPPATSASRLLLQLRDEAHRFGRKQHLRLRAKKLFL